MAIEAIGIHPNNQAASIGTSLSLASGDSAPSLEFRFATQSSAWLTANIWVTVDAVRKAGNESINGYENIGAAGAANVARTSFAAPTQADGLYIYKLALSDALMDDVETLLGTLTYSGRSYDAIRLTVEVRVVWGAQGQSAKGSQTCYIGFKPTYTCTGAYYDPKGLAITYTASNWNRPNDRWANGDLTSASEPLAEANAAWGTVEGYGKLVIPADKLLRIPATGDAIGGTIRMVGSWQDAGTTLGTLALSGTVTNLTQIKKPSITATAQTDGTIKVTVANGTGTGTAATAIDVSLVGSTYQLDKATLAPGESHYFNAFPAGTATTWQAVGRAVVGGVEYASGPATATVSAIGIDGAIIATEDGSVAVPYNATLNSQSSPESETVKLAGRERETVGFGEGGKVTWSLGGTIVTETLPGGDLTETSPDDVRGLPMRGVCVIRFQDGRRVQCYISSATVNRPVGGNGLRTVSITAEEVA